MDFIFNLMVAYENDMIIGHGPKLPDWQNTDDFKKNLVPKTLNSALIFGRNTAIGLGKPLKDRMNIAVTTDPERRRILLEAGFYVAENVYEAIALAIKHGYKTIWCMGGAKMYEFCLQHFIFDEIHITNIHGSFPAPNKADEIRFPGVPYDIYKIDPTQEVHYEKREPNPGLKDKGNKHSCTVEVWRKP
jgi:dihydrofolate reductase